MYLYTSIHAHIHVFLCGYGHLELCTPANLIYG